MREDAWLAARLDRPCFTVDDGDAPPAVDGKGFWQAKVDCREVARVAALEAAGFHVVDVNVTLRRDAGAVAVDGQVDVADVRPEQREAVLAIAENEYDVSRFHLDPAIDNAHARRIKRDWAAAVIDGERGERMLVASRDGEALGFLAVVRGDEGPVIDLIAVTAQARRRGAGRALVAALADEPITVGTQGWNTGALRFYEELGFLTVDTRYVLHAHGR